MSHWHLYHSIVDTGTYTRQVYMSEIRSTLLNVRTNVNADSESEGMVQGDG